MIDTGGVNDVYPMVMADEHQLKRISEIATTIRMARVSVEADDGRNSF